MALHFVHAVVCQNDINRTVIAASLGRNRALPFCQPLHPHTTQARGSRKCCPFRWPQPFESRSSTELKLASLLPLRFSKNSQFKGLQKKVGRLQYLLLKPISFGNKQRSKERDHSPRNTSRPGDRSVDGPIPPSRLETRQAEALFGRNLRRAIACLAWHTKTNNNYCGRSTVGVINGVMRSLRSKKAMDYGPAPAQLHAQRTALRHIMIIAITDQTVDAVSKSGRHAKILNSRS